MIGWVDTLCRDWAEHKRYVHQYITVQPLQGTLASRMICTQYRRGKRVGREPIRSVATRNIPKVWYPEVYSENALSVQRAIQGMPALQRAQMTVHYLYVVPLDRRIQLIANLNGGKAMSARTYWRGLHRVHCWIAANLPLTTAEMAG